MTHFFIFFVAVLFSQSGSARVYNYFDLPIGERAAGMGLTSIAASSDVGDAFFNPAAVADLHAPMIGASVSTYIRIDARTGEHVSAFESFKDSLFRGSVESIPSFMGGNFRTKGWVWGGGIVMPSTLSFNGSIEADSDNAISFSANTRSSHLLFFISKRTGDLSFGFSTTVVSSTEEERFFEITSQNPIVVNNSEYYYSLNALTSAFGLVWDAEPGLRLGFSASVPVALLGGDGVFAEVVSGDVEPTLADYTLQKHPFPARVSAGVEWTASPLWSFAFDAHWNFGFERELAKAAPHGILDIKAKSIPNFNFGAQWRLFENFGIRGGLFTNLSSSKKHFSRYATLQDSVNLYGATFTGYFPTPTGSISLGGFVQGGQGQMANLSSNMAASSSVPRSLYFYGFSIGSTYLFL